MPSLRSHIFRLFLRFAIAPRFRKAGESVAELRKVFAKLAKYQKIPSGIDVQSTTVGVVAGEWVAGPDAAEDRVVLFLHGGACIMGSPATHRELASHVALAGAARVLVIDYRLAPEHPFPAAVEDAMKAYRSLMEEGLSSNHIVIGGDSSGGGLTLQTLISLRDAGTPLPRAAFFLSPQTDWIRFDGESFKTRARKDPLMTLSTCRFTASCYVGQNDPSTPLLSPAHMNLSGLPPMLIHAGDREILLSDATRLADGAHEAGVNVTFKVWDGLWHGFHASASVVPEARRAISELGMFVREHLT
ncbi:MAG: alpha/beta hydrolase [Phycisphaerales bacterium]|nr:MAG: alpha/beta hydrolase [Phycisphaerales bacterium]